MEQNKKTNASVIDRLLEEHLDIVDQNDCVIQTLPRSEVYGRNLCSQMRSVWMMIRNSKGQLWIPRRSFALAILPGHLDGSVVGHVQAGESYEQAMHREAEEEVGIDMAYVSYRLLGKLNPFDHKSFCFSTVYECQLDQAPEDWNRDDIDSWQWMYPEEVLARCNEQEKFKDMLPMVIRHFYLP